MNHLQEALRAASLALHAGSPYSAVEGALLARVAYLIPETPCDYCTEGTSYETGATYRDPPEAVRCKDCHGTGSELCRVCLEDPMRLMSWGDCAGDACCIGCALRDGEGKPEPTEIAELAVPVARWRAIKREAAAVPAHVDAEVTERIDTAGIVRKRYASTCLECTDDAVEGRDWCGGGACLQATK